MTICRMFFPVKRKRSVLPRPQQFHFNSSSSVLHECMGHTIWCLHNFDFSSNKEQLTKGKIEWYFKSTVRVCDKLFWFFLIAEPWNTKLEIQMQTKWKESFGVEDIRVIILLDAGKYGRKLDSNDGKFVTCWNWKIEQSCILMITRICTMYYVQVGYFQWEIQANEN